MADNIQQAPYISNPLGPNNQPPLKDEAAIPVVDGGIPLNQEGVASNKYDTLDPVGNANIKFNQGNYQTMLGLPKLVSDKVAQLTQTFVPLIEVALIELMGSNTLYQRTLAQCMPSFDNEGKISIEFTFQYTVEHWVGQDIDQEAIQHDANYILEKIKPTKANITKCEIDCGNGHLQIMGSL